MLETSKTVEECKEPILEVDSNLRKFKDIISKVRNMGRKSLGLVFVDDKSLETIKNIVRERAKGNKLSKSKTEAVGDAINELCTFYNKHKK